MSKRFYIAIKFEGTIGVNIDASSKEEAEAEAYSKLRKANAIKFCDITDTTTLYVEDFGPTRE